MDWPTKPCKTCKIIKSLGDFNMCGNSRASYCKLCEKKRHRDKADKFPYLRSATSAKKRAEKKLATPSWANHEEIAKIYESCDFLNMVTGEWHQVDHIVPLRGKLVSGLHVPHNLQILPALENLRKSNKFIVE